MDPCGTPWATNLHSLWLKYFSKLFADITYNWPNQNHITVAFDDNEPLWIYWNVRCHWKIPKMMCFASCIVCVDICGRCYGVRHETTWHQKHYLEWEPLLILSIWYTMYIICTISDDDDENANGDDKGDSHPHLYTWGMYMEIMSVVVVSSIYFSSITADQILVWDFLHQG